MERGDIQETSFVLLIVKKNIQMQREFVSGWQQRIDRCINKFFTDLQPPLPIAPETVRIDRENSGVTIK